MRCGGSSSNLSITTVDVYGNSSPVRRNNFSRTNSLAKNFSLRSVNSSSAYHQACSGRYFSQIPNRRSVSFALLADMGTNSANLCFSCMVCSQGAISPRRWMLSSLLAINKVGMSLPNKARTRASAGVKLPASTTNKIRSTSATAPCTVLFSDLFSALVCRVWKPGVSTNTNWVAPRVCIPVMRWRVVCALREVMLIFCPTKAFSSVDLPTLGLPTIATKPQRWSPSAAAPGWVSLGVLLSRPSSMLSRSGCTPFVSLAPVESIEVAIVFVVVLLDVIF